MATVTNTLIQGLTDKMVQARLNTIDAKPFLFGTYFPVKKVNGFIWRTLTSQLAKRNVAADLHTDNGTTIRKRRPLIESAKGDIPFISISREMTRSEIKEYQTELAFANDSDASKLVQYWGEDVDFCFNGVQSELEYIAWAMASNAGKLAFTTTTNATYANEFDLDYDVSDFQKQKVSSDWASGADIIGDLTKLVKIAKDNGLNPKFAFINLDEFYRIACNDQIKGLCISNLGSLISGGKISTSPSLEDVNMALAKQAWLNGLQLRVIDQTITREFIDGTSSSCNPFADRRMIISETERLGTTQYDVLQENSNLILRAERAHTVVKKYGTTEPLSEVTIGQADAVPVFDTAYRNLYVRTDGKDWE